MILYNYYRSSASYRVRIALNIKNIHYNMIPINLIPAESDQLKSDYLSVNPQGLVPTLSENGHLLTQSLAIIEYLEELCPTPALLPKTPLARAQVRSLALLIASDIHPLNNLRVLSQLKQQFQASVEQTNEWYHHWLKKGFDAMEKQLKQLPRTIPVCYGHDVTLADLCLIPQVYNAKRFHFSLKHYPLIEEINEYCLTQSAFSDAAPTPI